MIRTPARLSTLLISAALLSCGSPESDGEQAGDSPSLPPDMADMTPEIVLETNRGSIVVELDRTAAPSTVENVVEHVEAGFYDGLIFHRVIPGFMIQGGGFTPDMSQRQTRQPPLQNEADNGLKNVRGSIAMARTNDPHSATTQFFINLADNPSLDHRAKTPQGWGYTVFGRVTEGMDVVDAIAETPTGTRGPYQNVPEEPVVIERAYVESEGDAAS